MKNQRFGKIMKYVWFKNETEYCKLISCIDGNFDEEVLKMMKEIRLRGDL